MLGWLNIEPNIGVWFGVCMCNVYVPLCFRNVVHAEVEEVWLTPSTLTQGPRGHTPNIPIPTLSGLSTMAKTIRFTVTI